MSDETNWHENAQDGEDLNANPDLQAFEKTLAALRPRTDRLDRRQLDAMLQTVLVGRGAKSEGRHESTRGNAPPCSHPAGHLFLCIHCGTSASTTDFITPAPSKRRWRRPLALSTMTALAASMLIVLVLYSTSHPTFTPNVSAPSSTATPLAHDAVPATAPTDKAAVRRWATDFWPTNPWATQSLLPAESDSGSSPMSYVALRDQVLRDGLDSWKIHQASSGEPIATPEKPATYREQLEDLLKETNHAS